MLKQISCPRLRLHGINQTIHRLYLEVVCKVSIVTPYDIIETEIKNQMLMGESVIVGNIPEMYLNLQND